MKNPPLPDSFGAQPGLSDRVVAVRTMHAPTILTCTIFTLSLTTVAVAAEDGPQAFAGVVTGISTLSADARSMVSSMDFAVSLYKPENGPALNLLVGVHLRDHVTIQANYIWNRNDLTLVAAGSTDTEPSFYEQPRDSSQHAVVGDLLVYFRARRSQVRPYLSVGAGIIRLDSRSDEAVQVQGAALPAPTFTATQAMLRVAVGLDLAIGHRWSVRYSFSESLSGNPVSERLSPPGQRGLANFQNLFGIVRAF